MKCYAGKILKINLSTQEVRVDELDKKDVKGLIGGRGLGVKLLVEMVKPKIDPFSSENPLIFATGPINGLIFPGASRVGVFFKSPLTGIFGESYCGGYFAPQMKFAGYDVIIVYGASKKPVYLTVFDEDIKIKDGSHLWGKDTFETEDNIKSDEGRGFQVVCIGPAGENTVKFACINHAKGRQFGRCGAGAVMGFKKLKAIAVKGSKRVEAKNEELFEEIGRDIIEKSRKRLKILSTYGTSSIISLVNITGTLPTRYWTEGEFEGVEEINAEAMKEKIAKRSRACYACPVACGKISKVESGPYSGTEVEGPEYETLHSFGPLCGNSNLESIAKANELCDRLGLDTITTGNVIAFAMKCCEKGILTDNDTGGLKFKFGDEKNIIDALPKIAYKEGFGEVLAEGVKGMAELIGKGADYLAIHVKGLEPPGYDPRGLKGVALAYAVSVRGACHLRHMAYRPNLTGTHPFRENVVMDRLSYDGQVEMVKEQEDFYAVVDSMILCKYVCLPTIGPVLWDEMAKIHSALTGFETQIEDLMKIGERINNLARFFNFREGVTRKNDNLPDRLLREELKKGGSANQCIQGDKLDEMLNKYYELRGMNHKGYHPDF